MNFSINDLKEFQIDSKTDKLTCTTSFVKPVHIVMMASIENYTDKNTSFTNETALQYAINMNFKNPLEIDTIDGLNHSKAIKLRNQFDDDGQVNKIMDIFHNNDYLDKDTNEIVSIILAEIFQNFYAHANNKQAPICCVQDWPASDYIEIAIADRGIGIKASLKDILKDYPEDINPCKIACVSGISCSLDKESSIGTKHSGYGLYFTKRFIEENKGYLYLASYNDCYEITPNSEFDNKLELGWKGTVVRLIINKTNFLDCESFFQTITKEQEGDDYDEFF